MRLHRAEVPDWSTLAPEQFSTWQSLAARTSGAVTPGNIISLVGGLVVAYGLYLITRHHLASGITIVLLGRLADVLDGFAAEATHTKSPVGEAADAAIDKIVLGLALLVLMDERLLPLFVGFVMLAQAAYNSVLPLIAKRHNAGLHPSSSGKLSAVFQWVSIGLYVLAAQISKHHTTAERLSLAVATLSFGLFVIWAVIASTGYSRQAMRKAA